MEEKRGALDKNILYLFSFFLGLGGGTLSFLIYLASRFFKVRSWRFKFDILPTLILFSFLLSAVFSSYRNFSLVNFTVFSLIYITYLFLRKEELSKDDTVRMLDYFVLGSSMLAFGGVVGYLYKGTYADTPFLGKNGIGTVLATAIPMVQLSILSKGEVYHYLFFIFTISGLILSMSQGAWVGLCLGEIFLLVFGDKKARKSVVMLLLFAILSLAIFAFHSTLTGTNLLSFFYTRLDPYSSSKVERIYIWKASIKIFLDYPIIGTGIGTFSLVYPKYKLPEAHEISMSFAHNLPLNLLAETGTLGFLSFFAFIVSLYKKGLSLYRKTQDNLILVLLSSLTAYLGHQLFDGTMWSLHIGLILWFMGAIISNFYERVR
ncbi:O-antigen ligase family protein [bacterium]|nr:O-antigen ligase family protein [bacterium]